MDRLPNTPMDTVANNGLDTSYTRLTIIDKETYLAMVWTDYQTHQSWTLYPTSLDISFVILIIIDRDIFNNSLDRLPNTSMDTESNNILDTSYTRLIVTD